MGKVRQLKRARQPRNTALKQGALPPHTVTSVLVQFEVEFRDDKGLVSGRKLTDPFPLYEAQYFPGLVEFIRSKGLTVSTVKEDDDAPAR